MHFFEPIFGVHLPDGLIQGPGIIAGWMHRTPFTSFGKQAPRQR